MRMTQRNREGIGCVGSQWSGNTQQTFHHQLYLVLLRGTGSDDGKFHLARRVFIHSRANRECGAQCSTSGLPELQSAVGIAAHEDPLDRNFIGTKLARHLIDPGKDLLQARSQRLSPGLDRPADDVRHLRAVGLDDCVPRSQRTGVQPQDAHFRGQRDLASIGRQLGNALRTPQSAQIILRCRIPKECAGMIRQSPSL